MWWYFTCKHVSFFFKSPILHVHFLQNLSTMNILDPIFYGTLFLKFSRVNPLINENLALGFHLFSKILFPTICVLLCTFNLLCLILQWKIRFVRICKISLKLTSELVKSGCDVKACFSLIFYPKNTKLVVMRRKLDYLHNDKKPPTF